MGEISKASFRGILAPDDRVNTTTVTTAPTQAGNKPGRPEALTNTDMVLHASGTQSANKDLRILAQRGGFPTLGQAGVVWKNAADAGTSYRGWDEYNLLNGWQAAVGADQTSVGLGTPTDCEDPHVVTLASGVVLAAYNSQHAPATATDNRLMSVALSPTTNQWGTPVEVYARPSFSVTPTGDLRGIKPSIVQLPSGRVVLFALSYKQETSVAAQADFWYSDDDGAVWTLGGENILLEAVANTNTVHKFRVAYSNGQMCMVMHVHAAGSDTNYADAILQYASDDYGNSFAKVDLWPITTAGSSEGNFGAKPDLAVAGGMFVMSYLGLTEYSAGLFRVYAKTRRAGNAFQSFRADTARTVFLDLATPGQNTNAYLTGVAPYAFGDGDTAIWADDDEALYVSAQGWISGSNVTHSEQFLAVSRDYGATWIVMGFNDAAEDNQGTVMHMDWFGGAGPEHLYQWTASTQKGRTVFLHNNGVTGPGDNTFKGSLFCAYLGGWSDLTMPGVKAESKASRRVGWGTTYIPIDLPAQQAWTKVATGAGHTETLQAAALRTQSGAGGDELYYSSASIASQIENGVMMMVDLKVTAAPDPAGGKYGPFMQIRLGDGTAGAARNYRVSCFLGTDKLVFRDDLGSVDYVTVSGIDTTAGVQVLLVAQETSPSTAKALAWYRTYTHGTFADDRDWIQAGSPQTLVVAAAAVNSEVRFGLAATGADARDATWYQAHTVGHFGDAGENMAGGFTNPDDLHPKTVGALPVYLNDGVELAATDGPAWPADSWKVVTRYTHPFDHVHPRDFPSPRQLWRSTGNTVEIIEWTLSSMVDYDTLGLLLTEINFRTATLEGYNAGTASYDTLATIDSAAEFLEIPYTRQDDVIILDTTGAAVAGFRYVHAGEMKGAVADLGSSKFREVLDNRGGIFRTQDTVKSPTLRLGGIDGTEPASGTVNIWMPRVLVVMTAVGNKYTRLRLTVDAQTTPQGYFQIGSAVLGEAHLLSQDYSWQRSLGLDSNVALTTAADGTRYSKVMGPSRRRVAFGWQEPVDTTPVSGMHPFPDYYKATDDAAALPVAMRGDALPTMRGLVESLNGPDVPVVYLANVPRMEPSSGSSKSVLFASSGDRMDAGASTVMNYERTQAFSFVCWLKRGDTTHAADEFIMRKLGAGGEGFEIIMPALQNKEIRFRLENAVGSAIGRRTSNEPLGDTLWHHVACTYDGGSARKGLKIYVDGILQTMTDTDSSSMTGSILNAGTMRLGSSAATIWDGNMDDVTVWTQELSQANVRLLFNHGQPSSPITLLGSTPDHWWDMGETYSAPTMTDKGSQGADLTVTGATIADVSPGAGPGSAIGAGVFQATSRERFLYGRILTDVEITTVLGEEDDVVTGELMTMGALTIEEEL